MLVGNGIGGGVEIADVAHQEPEGTSELAVGIGGLLQDVVPDEDVGGVVRGRHPQPQGIGTERGIRLLVLATLDDQLGVDDVTQGLGHLVTLLVEDKAVREYLLIRSPTRRGDAGEE